MVLKFIWLWFKDIFTFWKPMNDDDVPKWVWNAYRRWDRRLAVRPYNTIKHFVGKNHVYKVIHGIDGQGQCPMNWYKKNKT